LNHELALPAISGWHGCTGWVLGPESGELTMPSPPTPPTQVTPKAALAALAGVIQGIKHWAPVWIPSILLWQFATKGLVPAVNEARRLQEVAPEVDARHAEAKEAFEQVQAEAQAWQDPVYRERRRRLRFQEPSNNELASGEFVEFGARFEDSYTEDFAGSQDAWATAEEDWPSVDLVDLEDPVEFEELPTGPQHLTSPAEFLESYDALPVEDLASDPLLLSQGSWFVEQPAPEFQSEPLIAGSASWTSIPSVEPSVPYSNQAVEPQDKPESSFRLD
jgi:hypothetical protein